jgi:hypothetical protein
VEGWFPTPIFMEQVEGGDALSQLIRGLVQRLQLPLEKSNSQLTGDVRSGGNRPDIHQYLHLVPRLAPLFEALMEVAQRYADELGVDRTKENLYIGRSWLNVVAQRRGAPMNLASA